MHERAAAKSQFPGAILSTERRPEVIHVDISPEIEQRFADAARARGLETEDYARQIILSAVDSSPRQVSAGELLDGLRALSEHATAVTNYPADFFTREVIYGGHD
jgi:hypothetical protein